MNRNHQKMLTLSVRARMFQAMFFLLLWIYCLTQIKIGWLNDWIRARYFFRLSPWIDLPQNWPSFVSYDTVNVYPVSFRPKWRQEKIKSWAILTHGQSNRDDEMALKNTGSAESPGRAPSLCNEYPTMIDRSKWYFVNIYTSGTTEVDMLAEKD